MWGSKKRSRGSAERSGEVRKEVGRKKRRGRKKGGREKE